MKKEMEVRIWNPLEIGDESVQDSMVKRGFLKPVQKEIGPYAVGPVEVKEIKIVPLTKEEIQQKFKNYYSAGQYEVNVDTAFVHNIPTNLGTVFMVNLFEAPYSLPTEYLIVFPGRVPVSVCYLKDAKGRDGVWIANKVPGETRGNFMRSLKELEYQDGKKSRKMADALEWKQKLPQYRVINLIWTIQIFQYDDEHYAFLLKKPMNLNKWGEYKGFYFSTFLSLAQAVQQRIKEFNHCEINRFQQPFIYTHSILALEKYWNELNVLPADGSTLILDLNHGSGPATSAAQPPGLPIATAAVDPQSSTSPQSGDQDISREDPLTIAKRRLALGEISADEFKKIKDLLGE